jgi:hypothetical protein
MPPLYRSVRDSPSGGGWRGTLELPLRMIALTPPPRLRSRSFLLAVTLTTVLASSVVLPACGSDDASPEQARDASAPPVEAVDAGPAEAAADAATSNPCAPLAFPSGVTIQTFPDDAKTASYKDHLATGENAPVCFLDVSNLVDAVTHEVHPITVLVGAHFTLEELVGTEVSQGYGNLVLMEPAAVASLDKFRDAVNVSVAVNSGFRSPKHQEDVCRSLCGDPLGCSGTCANNSRHMFGDAFDLPLAFYTTKDEQRACDAGFKFAYKESGTHLHIDQNPRNQTCVIQ